jgi:4-hydroxy-3-polyprenylbenzoate decarboxylase/2,5-furandicarboxylate decarboxylase 2
MLAPSATRLIVGITGATGVAYAVRLLEQIRELPGWESHLVISPSGLLSAWHELQYRRDDLEKLADAVYRPNDIAAAISSGSFVTAGMVIAPCSMKTLSAVAHGYGDNLISRAADVCLKERRRLVLMARETPLNLAHIRNMAAVTEMGGIVYPPVPALYALPKSIDDVINHTVGRVLDLFGADTGKVQRWTGMGTACDRTSAREELN